MSKTISKIVVKDLLFGATDLKPRPIAWAEIGNEQWGFWDADTCSECGEILVLESCGEQQHKDIDHAVECSGFLNTDGPLMSTFWPLPDGAWDHDPKGEAMKLAGLPLCLVRLDGTAEWGLALTGGGMNLSWEIAEAYIRLGLLPPEHIELPVMADRGKGHLDRSIIAAMARAYQVARNQLRSKLLALKRFAPGKAKAAKVKRKQ